MIKLYVGRPGSGKSLDSIQDIRCAIRRGKIVVSNFWLNRLGLPGAGKYVYLSKRVLTPDNIVDNIPLDKAYKEGRYLLVLDECQLLFNARDWQRNSSAGWVQFMTQHRKLGFDIILIVQHEDMIDKQIRNCVDFVVEHRKVSRFGPAAWLMSVVLGGYLRIVRYYGQDSVISRSFFRGGRRLYDLYDTSAIF